MKKYYRLSMVFLLLFVFTASALLSGCTATTASSSGNPDYKAVVKAFMGAVNTPNAKKLLGCFQKDDKSAILDEMEEADLKTALEDYKTSISDEYGEDWYKNLDVTGREKVDTTDEAISYDVTLEIDGEAFDTLPILKINSKYYMDRAALDKITGGGGGGGGAEDVVSNFFDSIDKQDVDLFLKCFTKDARDTLMESNDVTQIADGLTYLDESLNDEFGDDWRSQVKIGEAEKGDTQDDTVFYDVPVTMQDNEDSITVLYIDGDYYLDESAMGDLGTGE